MNPQRLIVHDDNHVQVGEAHLRIRPRDDNGRTETIGTFERGDVLWIPAQAEVMLLDAACIENERRYSSPKEPFTMQFASRLQELAEMNLHQQLAAIDLTRATWEFIHAKSRRRR